MQPEQPAPKEQPSEHPAAQHVGEAHRLLEGLRAKLGTHPELDEAIEELQLALSVLTVKTGGML
jgi:uncharacterized caspase-like protein